MGYNTDFKGVIEFDKEISEKLKDEINEFCDKRHCLSETGQGINTTPDYAPGLWCNWLVTNDRKGLTWNCTEKSYEMDKWLVVLIKRFLKPKGLTCNGEVEAQGEKVGNHWLMVVVDNVLTVKHAGF